MIDESTSSRPGSLIVRFVDQLTLQARKNGYCTFLGTQKFEHLDDGGLVDQFQFYLIGSQQPSSIRRLAGTSSNSPMSSSTSLRAPA